MAAREGGPERVDVDDADRDIDEAGGCAGSLAYAPYSRRGCRWVGRMRRALQRAG